jgi:hypothetical protein
MILQYLLVRKSRTGASHYLDDGGEVLEVFIQATNAAIHSIEECTSTPAELPISTQPQNKSYFTALCTV